MCRVSAARSQVASLLRHLGQSRACVSQQLMSMLRSLREVFRQSFKRFICPPTVCLPWPNSLYSICFGSRLSGILTTCPAHLACVSCMSSSTTAPLCWRHHHSPCQSAFSRGCWRSLLQFSSTWGRSVSLQSFGLVVFPWAGCGVLAWTR